jgi:hypothetical protein
LGIEERTGVTEVGHMRTWLNEGYAMRWGSQRRCLLGAGDQVEYVEIDVWVLEQASNIV